MQPLQVVDRLLEDVAEDVDVHQLDGVIVVLGHVGGPILVLGQLLEVEAGRVGEFQAVEVGVVGEQAAVVGRDAELGVAPG